jgi:hypothetical protein
LVWKGLKKKMKYIKEQLQNIKVQIVLGGTVGKNPFDDWIVYLCNVI